MVAAVEAPPDDDARKVLSLLPYAVVVVDREWRITFVNNEAHRLLGQQGATLWELCPELAATPFGTAFRYAMTDRAELISESALPTVGWLHARAKPFKDGLVITLRPIYPESADSLQAKQALELADEARETAERELRAQAEQLELINEIGKNLTSELELVPLAQRVTNLATRLARAAYGAFYFDYDATTDQLLRVAVAGATRDALPLPVRPSQMNPTALGSGLPSTSFFTLPVIARGGAVVGAFVFGHDAPGIFTEATERLLAGVASQAAIAMDNARLFASARELIAQLERTNAELDQFAYVASHDLKAPLRGIANLSQWVEEDLGDTLDDQGRHHLKLLRGRVARLESLIEGILSYSRADRARGNATDIDLGPFVRDIWELIAAPPTAHLTVHELPRLLAERIPLQQVLMNLMSNAVKYNANRELHVEVGARPEGDAWAIYVKDDGVGIPAELQQRIWGLFQTLEPRDTVESTGIGLAVVRKIIESRGGRAWVESEPGAGATFWFTLPADSSTRRKRHGRPSDQHASRRG